MTVSSLKNAMVFAMFGFAAADVILYLTAGRFYLTDFVLLAAGGGMALDTALRWCQPPQPEPRTEFGHGDEVLIEEPGCEWEGRRGTVVDTDGPYHTYLALVEVAGEYEDDGVTPVCHWVMETDLFPATAPAQDEGEQPQD